ncbi:Uma2 family endonuclease [Stratiformator vulcanicus]|uniref:Putative restriction endonuclease domain-containing protein n=1 Tax=Stratiformator vulcanicus TaxID=2527980 RepID=A0A517QVM2_9PLAN|nr:Uma2 family endonuclease [Stratiformator vulcanicus]QDT35671.1 hypothetical protein Pan189_00240 [Stratiformator vulcanicus]
MTSRLIDPSLPPREGEPVYRVAELLPPQGLWSVEQYLMLDDDDGAVELVDGRLEFPHPLTDSHQSALASLMRLLHQNIGPKNGIVLPRGLRVRTGPQSVREPDIVALLDRRDPRRSNRIWQGADLVVEVISEDDFVRDLITKRSEYASAEIPEYWIADPRDRSLTIFRLNHDTRRYLEHAKALGTGIVRSALIPELAINVKEVFASDIE